MKNIIEDYLRKILEFGCNVQKDDNLIVYSNEEIPYFKETLLKIKDDYKINQIIFFNFNYEEIYNFLKTNPTEEEIRKYIYKYPKIKNPHKTKMISFYPNDYDGYYYKLSYEMYEYTKKYSKIDSEINKEIYEIWEKFPQTVTVWPTKSWAKNLLGSYDKIEELWILLSQAIPSKNKLLKTIEKLEYIRGYLNELSINELYFSTKLGTDFRIKLTKNSNWVALKKKKNNIEYFPNFPTYEIFTAPNYRAAEGKIIMTKPSVLYGMKIKEAELLFSKGRIITCQSDNEEWTQTIMNARNHLNRIGEIALVSSDSPLAELNRTFNSLILDENAGCHLALGYPIRECIKMSEEKLKEKGYKNYNFNDSNYHQDLIFGDQSIIVEAKTRNKKMLILENGKWQI